MRSAVEQAALVREGRVSARELVALSDRPDAKDPEARKAVEAELAKVLDHEALNQAAASLYRDRFDSLPGIVYAAGVDHAYNLAKEFRAAGLKAEAVSGRTPPVQLAAAAEADDIRTPPGLGVIAP